MTKGTKIGLILGAVGVVGSWNIFFSKKSI